MKKIKSSSEIIVGREYLFEETNENPYFKEYPTKVIVDYFDGKDFWGDTRGRKDLAGEWVGYGRVCFGRPEDDDCDFYESLNN